MKKEKAIYILDSGLSWKTFKKLNEGLSFDSGPVPVHGDRILWQLNKEKKITLFFDTEIENELFIGKIPRGRKVYVIKENKEDYILKIKC